MDDVRGEREVNAEAVLNLWETVHGCFTDDQRRSFLARQEVQTLAGLPDQAVLAAVPRSAKLSTICQIATKGAWWYEGAPCEEDNLAWCARCKPHPYPAVVVITTGWSGAFHRSAECRWLIHGQSTVANRGGEPAPIERVSVQVALGAGKFACLACFPPS